MSPNDFQKPSQQEQAMSTIPLTINTFDGNGNITGKQKIALSAEQIADIISHASQVVNAAKTTIEGAMNESLISELAEALDVIPHSTPNLPDRLEAIAKHSHIIQTYEPGEFSNTLPVEDAHYIINTLANNQSGWMLSPVMDGVFSSFDEARAFIHTYPGEPIMLCAAREKEEYCDSLLLTKFSDGRYCLDDQEMGGLTAYCNTIEDVLKTAEDTFNRALEGKDTVEPAIPL